MSNQPCQHPAAGFTLVELLCVMAIIGLLVALLLPALALGKDRARRIVCVNNEREQGLAFHMFLHDHDGKFPMAVPVSEGGSEEFAQNGLALGGQFYFSYHHFQVLSNDSAVPPELICPADDRAAAVNMGRLKNANLSYFVGINASYNQPESILAGDRNMSAQSATIPTIQNLEPGSRLRWTRELHRYKGNVLFADGHVEFWNQLNLTANLRGRNTRTVLFLPSVSEAPSSSGGGFNRPSPESQPAGQPGFDGGNPNANPSWPPRASGNTSRTGAQTPNPNPPATPPEPTSTVIPLPTVNDVSGTPLPATGGAETALNGGTGATGTSAGFQAFITSGWWFWLCLLLALGLAESWRRALKNRAAKNEAEENTPADV